MPTHTSHKRACTVCGQPCTGSRCTRHAIAEPDYGHRHRQQRATLLPQAIGTRCPLCSKTMTANQPLDLDHTTNAMTHATCNRRAGQALVH